LNRAEFQRGYYFFGNWGLLENDYLLRDFQKIKPSNHILTNTITRRVGRPIGVNLSEKPYLLWFPGRAWERITGRDYYWRQSLPKVIPRLRLGTRYRKGSTLS